MKSINSLLLIFFIITITSCFKINQPPVIADQVFYIDENPEKGALAGQVVAIDAEDIQNLSYSITDGNTYDAFEINEADGKIYVLNEDAVDFETTPLFSLKVEVKDSKGKSATGTVTINLKDVKPPENGLILYMPFDGNVKDSSESRNNGIDHTSQNYVKGKYSKALNFNGTSDYIQLSNTINASNGLTFSFWVNSRGTNGVEENGVIAGKYNMTTQQRCFLIYSFGYGATREDNRLSATFYRYSSSSFYHDHVKSYLEPDELTVYPDPLRWTIINPVRLPAAKWVHCVINMTPTLLECWLNDTLCTKKLREYTSYFDTPNEPVYIGNILYGGSGSNNHFNGMLDELRIYSRALTKEEIRTLSKEK